MMQSYDDIINNNNRDQSFNKNQNSTNNNSNNNLMDLESFIGKETQIQTLLPPLSSDLSNNKNDESELIVDSSSSGKTNNSSSLGEEEEEEGDLLLPFGDELLLSIDNDPTITIHFSGTTNNKSNIASASDTTVTNMGDLNLNNKGIDDEIDTYIEALLSLNINTTTMDGSLPVQQQQEEEYNKNEIMDQQVVVLNKGEEGGEENVACLQCTSNDDYDGVCQLTRIFNKFTIEGSVMKKKKRAQSKQLIEQRQQQNPKLNPHYDVLFVRGKNQQLPGNIYYKSLISKNLKRYNECTKRQEKTLITWEIIHHIKKDVGGTFYENACEGEGELHDYNNWIKIERRMKKNENKAVRLVKVPDLRVRKKISQAFRDLNRNVRKDT